ncbi:unnamed protein product, partial [Discosporangium mesarthrocarpum]
QLSVYSIILYLPKAISSEGGFLSGWTLYTCLLAVLSASGGILVALSVKHTDSILKTFATSGSIIVCAVAGHYLMDAPLNIPIAAGAICAILSLLNYSDEGDPGMGTGGPGAPPGRWKGGTGAGGGAGSG